MLLAAAAAASTGTARAQAPGGPAYADPEHDHGRKILEDAYVAEYQTRNSIYQSAPLTHIVPSFKTVTLALAADRYDVRLVDDHFGNARPFPNAEQRLNLTGHKFAPYIAVSLQRIGLGFGAETGTKSLRYSLVDKTVPDATGPLTRSQKSDMTYNAVGVYAYLLPYATTGQRAVIASVVLGAKSYNVTHQVTPTAAPVTAATAAQDDQAARKFRYNIAEYELGCLVELRLLKNFSLIPWVDYTYIDIRDPITQADNALKASGTSANYQDTQVAPILKGDTMMFWRARPRVDFGLDLVARTHGFAVHLGELFGALIASRDTDLITDKSYYLSFSFDLKGE